MEVKIILGPTEVMLDVLLPYLEEFNKCAMCGEEFPHFRRDALLCAYCATELVARAEWSLRGTHTEFDNQFLQELAVTLGG